MITDTFCCEVGSNDTIGKAAISKPLSSVDQIWRGVCEEEKEFSAVRRSIEFEPIVINKIALSVIGAMLNPLPPLHLTKERQMNQPFQQETIISGPSFMAQNRHDRSPTGSPRQNGTSSRIVPAEQTKRQFGILEPWQPVRFA